VLNQPESVRLLPRGSMQEKDGGQVPAYGYPEAAVAAMARAASYGAWRAAPRGHMPDFADIRAADARALAHEFLRQAPDGGWLSAGQTTDLLGCYGILLAGGEDASAAVAARAGGTEVIVRVAADHTFGPLVMFGLGGAARLTPLTDIDADQLIRSVYPGGSNPAAPPYVRDLLLRVSRLTDDLPEVTGLDLNPVTAWPDRAIVRAARITMAPCEPQDPFLRKLR
jgi:ATP-grasp domain